METQTKMQKKWSKAMVVYHWLAAIVILGLLLTGISHMSVLNPRTIAENAAAMASQHGVTLSRNALRAVGGAVNGAVMNIHFILGYSLAILIIFRIILFFTGDQRVFKMAKKSFSTDVKKHKPLVNILYLALYLGILTMAITGLSMKFGGTLGISHDTHEFIQDIHVTVMYCILAFVFVHLIGIFRAENTDQPGVTSSMMSGVGEEDEVMLNS
jgi:cytochrome b561